VQEDGHHFAHPSLHLASFSEQESYLIKRMSLPKLKSK
jgi:hypothetical protein